MAGLLLGSAPQRLQIDLWGVDETFRVPVAVAAVKGVLTPFLEGVNYVNAERIAEGRGIEVVRSTHNAPGDYPHLVCVALTGGGKTIELGGTLFGERDLRVVRFGGFRLEFRPEGKLLFLENLDVPGVVGKVGTLLAEAGINIADIHLARLDGKIDGEREAMAVLRLDQEPSDELLARLHALNVVRWARRIDLGKR